MSWMFSADLRKFLTDSPQPRLTREASKRPALKSPKPHKIGTIFRLPRTGRAYLVNESQKFSTRWQIQPLLSYLHARESSSRIIESRAGANRLFEDRANAVVYDAGGVSLLISTKPSFAISLSNLAHVGGEYRLPGTADEIDHHLAVFLRS